MASGLLGIGVSGLVAFQRALSVTSNNIANANTEGYNRQRVDLNNNTPSFSGGFSLGTGVEVANVTRIHDNFVETQVRNNTSAVGSLDRFFTLSSQLDNLFADPAFSVAAGIGDFFNSMQGLSNDPSSAGARHAFLTEAELMVNQFHQMDERFATVEQEVGNGLRDQIGRLNDLALSLRNLNSQIITATRSDQRFPPNDLLDQRDQIINQMSELVDIQVTTEDNGSQNVFIGNGQSLVVGEKAFQIVAQSGLYDPGKIQIVTQQGVGAVDISNRLSGGQIGGLLEFRDQVLYPQRKALGQLALSFASELNRQHELGVDANGNLGAALFKTGPVESFAFSSNAGGSLSVTVSDHNDVEVSDYVLFYTGSDSYSLERLSDGSVTTINTGGTSPFTATVDGLDFAINSTGIGVGDSFLVRPTLHSARDIELNISRTDQIAVASAVVGQAATDANGGPSNSGNGSIGGVSIGDLNGIPLSGASSPITLTFNPNALGAGVPGFDVSGAPGPIAYDPLTQSDGLEINFSTVGNIKFTLSGVPVSGDSFVVSNNVNGVGDNTNALAMASLETAKIMQGSAATFGDAYAEIISDIGARTRRADVSLQAQTGLLNQSIAQHESVSGVNLDEEAANLLRFQNAYQAAAQVISITQTLFQTLLSSFGR